MSTFYTIPICLSWFVYNIYNLYLYINTFFMYSLNEFSPSFFKVQKSYLVEQQFFLSIYCLQCSPRWKIIVDKSCGKIRKKVRIKKSLFSNKNHSYFILKKITFQPDIWQMAKNFNNIDRELNVSDCGSYFYP